MMRWAGYVAVGREERRIQGFGEETWERETTWDSRRRFEDNNNMDLQEVGYVDMDGIKLAQD